MSAAPCYMCKGTRWIRLYGGPGEGSMEAPCIACNPSGAEKPAATSPEMGSVEATPVRRQNEAVDPMVWCDCLRATLPLTAKNAGLPCDVCHEEQQQAAA